MIVTQETFRDVVEHLSKTGVYSVDTETTGLRPYHGDRLFSLIITDDSDSTYYFNFSQNNDCPIDSILLKRQLGELAWFFLNPESLLIFSNAKFDMAMLAGDGIEIRAKIHCTEAIGRVEKNNRFKYRLDSLAKELGFAKDDAVKKYVSKHKLMTLVPLAAKKDPYEIHHYDRVPFDIIEPYAEHDAKLTRIVGLHQIKRIEDITYGTPAGLPTLTTVMENERRLTKTLFHMEREGILVNRAYTENALALETRRYEAASTEFQALTGEEFSDSPTRFAKIFKARGIELPLTEKGRPSCAKGVLKTLKDPLAKVILDYRKARKKAGTYYSSFIFGIDEHGYLHANFRQGGTEPGRMSASDPNLQNLHKPDSGAHVVDEDALTEEESSEVRRCFIPPPGECLVMIDYDQMEYKLMLDYAGELDLVREVLAGVDLHEATAQMLGISRQFAKTLNFCLLYGGGAGKIAQMLKITLSEAKALKARYFARLPMIRQFAQRVINSGEQRGYIFNWLGRRCHIADRSFAYVLPNHLIQGGCADVMKVAMNRIDDLLVGKRTKMRIQIHDELVFSVPPGEFDLVPQLKTIMETVYPHKHLPLTCSVDHSWLSWADKTKGFPVGKKARDTTQGMDQAAPRRLA